MKNYEETRKLINEYPKINHKIKIISMFSKELIDKAIYPVNSRNGNIYYGDYYCYITKTLRNFIYSLLPGDILLFEYPMWYENKGSGNGLYMFSISVTNMRTGKDISIRAPKLMYIYTSIEEFEEIK